MNEDEIKPREIKFPAMYFAETARTLRRLCDDYENSGDWWGCVQHAAAFLEEALASGPPGMMGGCHGEQRPKWEQKK